MSGLLSRPWLVNACRIGIGVVFIAAGLSKIGGADAFVRDVHGFRLAPIALENLIAIVLPWVEVVAGVAMLAGRQRRAGSWIAFLLMLLFTVAVGQAVARGLENECGCFGAGSGDKSGVVKLLENVVLTAAAFVATRSIPSDDG